MKKFQSILLVIVLFALAFLGYDNWQMKNKFFQQADTTIHTVINQTFDTVLHNTMVKNTTINNPVKVYYTPYHDSNLCDSVRVYTPESEDSNVKVYATISTQGKLVDYKLDYKFKKPVFTEKITTLTINNKVADNGFMLGLCGNALYADNIKYGLGLTAGYKFNKWIITYSGTSNGSNLLSVNKIFDVRKH